MRRAAAVAAALLMLVPLTLILATVIAPGWDHIAQDRLLAGTQGGQATWRAASWPGDTWVGLAIAAGFAAACAARGARRTALVLAVGAIAQVAVVQGLKRLIGRTRPEETVVDGFAFPSGHSATAAAVYGLVALVAMPVLLRGRAAPLLQRLAIGLWLGLSASVGFARVAGGAHYPADVLAGWALGGAVVALAVIAAAPEKAVDPAPAQP